jgi:hypothetical protein
LQQITPFLQKFSRIQNDGAQIFRVNVLLEVALLAEFTQKWKPEFKSNLEIYSSLSNTTFSGIKFSPTFELFGKPRFRGLTPV